MHVRLLALLLLLTPATAFAAPISPAPQPTSPGTLGPPGDAVEACAAIRSEDFSTLPAAPSLIVSATLVEATAELPRLCRLEGRIAPTIGYRMWLPLATWNGKYAQGGCGGRCGGILDEGCEVVVARGYACLAADMGHQGTQYDDLWAIGNVSGEIDYGFRSTHVAAITGKAVIERFYRRKPRYSYFFGASQGGRQGLVEAQRFPYDFDGIVAGEPRMAKPAFTPEQHASLYAAIQLNPGGHAIVGADDLRRINAYVTDKCDMDDGLKDGIVSDPRSCRFDPGELGCAGGRTPPCLRDDQVAVLRDVYRGTVDERGFGVQSGPLPGSELHWIGAYITEDGKPGRYAPRWAYMPGSGYQHAFYDSSNPDLRPFKQAGGKLILYMGWYDETNVPGPTIDYYETVERLMGGRVATQDFFRLFMVPGQGHIPTGNGAETIDYLSYLEAWVERGQAPNVLLAAKLKRIDRFAGPVTYAAYLKPDNVAFTRPVWPYPVMARYAGKGDPNDAASFVPAKRPASLRR